MLLLCGCYAVVAMLLLLLQGPSGKDGLPGLQGRPGERGTPGRAGRPGTQGVPGLAVRLWASTP